MTTTGVCTESADYNKSGAVPSLSSLSTTRGIKQGHAYIQRVIHYRSEQKRNKKKLSEQTIIEGGGGLECCHKTNNLLS